MSQQEKIYYIILIAVMLLGIAATFLFRKTTDPVKLRRKVEKALLRFARPRKYRVLNNVAFDTREGRVTVDHLLVGYFGVLFVGDLVLDGDYYGEMEDKTWICSRTERSTDTTTRVGSQPNPVRIGRLAMEAARERCARAEIFNLPMEAIAVKAYKSGDFVITGSKDYVMTLPGLRNYLLRSWIEKDTGLDVEAVSKALLAQ